MPSMPSYSQALLLQALPCRDSCELTAAPTFLLISIESTAGFRVIPNALLTTASDNRPAIPDGAVSCSVPFRPARCQLSSLLPPVIGAAAGAPAAGLAAAATAGTGTAAV